MDKTKAEIKKFKKLEQEAHNGTVGLLKSYLIDYGITGA